MPIICVLYLHTKSHMKLFFFPIKTKHIMTYGSIRGKYWRQIDPLIFMIYYTHENDLINLSKINNNE